MRWSSQLLTAGVILLAAGCASSSASSAGSRTNPNLITAGEVGEAFGTSAYEIIQELRPGWLQDTGRGMPTVYFDDRPLGGVDELRRIPRRDIGSMRFFRFSEAQGRFPRFREGSGVVQVLSPPRVP